MLIQFINKDRDATTSLPEVVSVPRTGQQAHVHIHSQSNPPPDFHSVIEIPPPSYQDHSKDVRIT